MSQIFKVEAASSGMRLDQYLAKMLSTESNHVSRSTIQKAIEKQLVLVNQKLVKASYLVKENDLVSYTEIPLEVPQVEKKDLNLDIVYEDDDLLIINKPSGLVVHPATGHYDDTLVSGLLYHSDSLSDVNGSFRPGIVHRIDKDTSGLLIVCKNNYSHEKMAEAIKNKVAKREYVALVYGNFPNKSGKINAPIGRDPLNRQKQAVVENGKPAVTHFTVLEQYNGYSLLRCQLETGRTHQIRVHLAYINHPVYGDSIYGPKKNLNDFGQYLHADKLVFPHPRSGKMMTFTCPLPKAFLDKIEQIKND